MIDSQLSCKSASANNVPYGSGAILASKFGRSSVGQKFEIRKVAWLDQPKSIIAL